MYTLYYWLKPCINDRILCIIALYSVLPTVILYYRTIHYIADTTFCITNPILWITDLTFSIIDLHSILSTVHSVLPTVPSVLSTVQTVLLTYNLYYRPFFLLPTVYSVLSSYTLHYRPKTVLRTVYKWLPNVHSVLHTVHCIIDRTLSITDG